MAQAAEQIQLQQKALDQMNLHLHHVLADLAGSTGTRIVEAILAGERDPAVLAQLRDPRVRADAETLQAALTGDWRPEHLFTLKQARESFLHYHQQLTACDAEIEQWLERHPVRVTPPADPALPAASALPAAPGETPPPPRRHSHRNAPVLSRLDLGRELAQRFGVEVTAIPGIGVSTASLLYAELGADLHAFPTAAAFCSWLGLCPDPRKSGGQVIRHRTRGLKHRVAGIFRQAAPALARGNNSLGSFYRKIRGRCGGPAAVTATAHKLARIFYHLVTTKEAYDEAVFAWEDARQQQRRLKALERQAQSLGYSLAPLPEKAATPA